MGNQACCAVKDSEVTTGNAELSKAEAVPVLDGGIKAAEKEEPTYEVMLDKSTGGKLGLDVDYMAERRVLPVMSITGGLAEQWNQANPHKQISKGDSLISVNGVKGDVAIMLERCKTEKVLQLVLAKRFNYDHLVADVENLVTTQGCGSILIRLSWHDAGVYKEGQGGCPNAAMRFADGGESKFDANKGLQNAISLLRPISDKYVPDLITHADLWSLAANVAIRVMAGPTIPTRFGRPDAKSSAEGVSGQEGRLPDGDKGADHLRAIFNAKGFNDKEIVALSGAHTVGRCHLDRSGFDGAWTEQPLKFDNSYFKELLAKTYAPETTAKGCPQHRHGASRTMMLPTDKALLDDSTFKLQTETYASDQAVWFSDFGLAWKKLQENGHVGLRDVL